MIYDLRFVHRKVYQNMPKFTSDLFFFFTCSTILRTGLITLSQTDVKTMEFTEFHFSIRVIMYLETFARVKAKNRIEKRLRLTAEFLS